MKAKEDRAWESLILQSAPAYRGPLEPPFGLTTSVLARLREQRKAEALWDRLGRRALQASLGAVLSLALFTWVIARPVPDDLDPAVNSLALVDNLPIS